MANTNREDAAREIAENKASIAAFRHPAEVIDQDVRDDMVSELAGVLTPVFQFIARGRRGGTMSIRSWVVLYETRLDMVAGESIELCAKREGVSATRIHELIKEFRAALPGYRSPNCKSAETRAKMSAAHRKARAQATPGKESFLPGRRLAGSAHSADSHTGGSE